MNCWLVETGTLRKTDRVENGVGAAEVCLRPASLTAAPAGTASRRTPAAIRPTSTCETATTTASSASEQEMRGTMNDPQVVALIYTVEHGDSVDYKNAEPIA